MKVACFALILLFLPLYFTFTHEEERSPLYYRGVDVCMSPQEVVNILGKPDKEEFEMDKDQLEYLYLYFYYSFPEGTNCKLEFYEARWLKEIIIIFPEAKHYREFSLNKNDASGFKLSKLKYREKWWHRNIYTKKWGTFEIRYIAKEGNEKLITFKRTYINNVLTCLTDEKTLLNEAIMYYKGVYEGMSPQNVKKILGTPDERDKMDNDLLYTYYLPGGGTTSIFFHKRLWLKCIIIGFPAPLSFVEFGFDEDGNEDFKTYIDDDGNKVWNKIVEHEKYGKILIGYQSEPGHLNLIGSKIMFVVNPEVFEK